MGLGSFLKKVGLGIIKYTPMILGLEQSVGSAISLQVPAAKPTVDRLGVIIGSALQIQKDFETAFAGQDTGPQKLLALSAQVGDILKQSELAVGHNIVDEAKVQTAATGIAQGIVDFLKALEGKDGSTVSASQLSR